MKKLVITSMVAGLLLTLGVGFAQSSQQHDVTVTIPNVLMIRIVNDASNAVVQNPAPVTFDLATRLNAGGDNRLSDSGWADVPFMPDAGANWDDIRVFTNRPGTWTVTISLRDTSEDVPEGEAFDWSKLSVLGSATGVGLGAFGMPADGNLASFTRTGRANWLSLGFGPSDFRLTLDGTELARSYSATITYEIAAP